MINFKAIIAFSLAIVLVYSKLVQVVSFFRHGARYPLNGYYDGNQTKYIWGELTSVGMRQHQTLGQIIKKQYIEKQSFLSPTYDRSQIQVYSTSINRTIQSVISQLYGIYPAGTGPKLLQVKSEYYLPPYSNKTNDKQKTFAFPNGYQQIPVKFDQKIMMNSCQNQGKQAAKNIQLQYDEYKQMNLTYWPFIKRMATIFNLTGNVTLDVLASLNSNLDCDRFLNRPLPKQYTAEDQRNLRHIDSWYKQFILVKDLAKAMNRNRFMKILSVFDNRIRNPNQNLKWTFLSGHDNDMIAMYTDLNLSTSQCVEQLYRKGKTTALNCQQYPSFAASLIFQLYVEGSVNSIKIRSNGKYMKLCGKDSQSCSYEEWKKAIQSNMASPQLTESICGVKKFTQQLQSGQQQSLGSKFRKMANI